MSKAKKSSTNRVNKRGTLSAAEKRYIEKFLEYKTDEEIAAVVKRPTKTIHDYRLLFLTKPEYTAGGQDEIGRIKEELYLRPEYESLRIQFTDEEWKVFEATYVDLMRQFKEDILPTERQQIYHAVALNIQIFRFGRDRAQVQNEIDRLNVALDAEYAKKTPNRDALMNMETLLQTARAGSKSKTDEYNKSVQQFSSVVSDLNGKREQRKKNSEDLPDSFPALIRKVQDKILRERMGKENELMNLAAKKEKDRFYTPHQYANGEIDCPILNSESVHALYEEKE